MLIEKTFSFKSKKLPTIAEIHKIIEFDTDGFNNTEKYLNTYTIRRMYNKYCFPILNHEFFTDLSKFCKKPVVELCCGTGWFSYWMKKYGIQVKKSVDNKSWGTFNQYLPFVYKCNAIRYVKKNNVKMYILSWPYMDDVAFKIWKYMKKDQYLLYIGESEGGCTANDKFFDAVEKKEIKTKLNKNFVSFWGIHDRVILYRR